LFKRRKQDYEGAITTLLAVKSLTQGLSGDEATKAWVVAMCSITGGLLEYLKSDNGILEVAVTSTLELHQLEVKPLEDAVTRLLTELGEIKGHYGEVEDAKKKFENATKTVKGQMKRYGDVLNLLEEMRHKAAEEQKSSPKA